MLDTTTTELNKLKKDQAEISFQNENSIKLLQNQVHPILLNIL